MIAGDLGSRIAFTACLLACSVGWVVLPFMPGPMPGDPLPGGLPVLQQVFAWWPLSLLPALGIPLALPRLTSDRVALRRTLRVAQWLLALASVALVVAGLFETFSPRPD